MQPFINVLSLFFLFLFPIFITFIHNITLQKVLQLALQLSVHTLCILCTIINYNETTNQAIIIEEGNMSFEIKSNKIESENKTIRFPISLINRINGAIQNKNTSFSSFVIQACEYALENIHDKDDSI